MTPRAMLLALLKGMCMGTADVVPGVSGGTMALILGIYERLLRAVRNVDLEFLRLLARLRVAQAAERVDFAFLLSVGLGILAALLFFTRVVSVPGLIGSHPELIYGLFFGLIVASIGVLLHAHRPITAAGLGWLALGTVTGLAVVNLVPVQTPTASWFIFLCGALAISAMILPGISGSFILLVLQKYAYVFDAIGRLDFSVILPFALGCACGIAAFSRLLTWLLRRFHHATLMTVIGFLVGSLWMVWPYQERIYTLVRGKQRLVRSVPALPEQWDAVALAALALAATGAVAVVAINAAARRRQG